MNSEMVIGVALYHVETFGHKGISHRSGGTNGIQSKNYKNQSITCAGKVG